MRLALLLAFVLSADLAQPAHTKPGVRQTFRLGAASTSPNHYQLTDLGTLPGMDSSGAYGLDSQGHVVGSASVLTGYVTVPLRPVFFDRGRIRSLGLLPRLNGGTATGISTLGLIVGEMIDMKFGDERARGFLWQNGILTDLGTLSGYSGSAAIGVNSHGQVTGSLYDAQGHSMAFLWQRGRMHRLGTLPSFQWSTAKAINEHGEIAGYALGTRALKAAAQAFLYSNGKMRALGRLGGDYSLAYGLNAGGEVVGETTIGRRDAHGNPITHPFLWARGGGMSDLGSLGGTYAEAHAINRRRQVVGSATRADGRSNAFLWEKGKLYDLNDLIPPGSGWVLSDANAINDQGQIVGTGVVNGHERAFCLTQR